MYETQRRLLAQAIPGLHHSQAYRGEGRLDGVRRPQPLPVRHREIVEDEQLLLVPNQTFGGFRVFRVFSGSGGLPMGVKSL